MMLHYQKTNEKNENREKERPVYLPPRQIIPNPMLRNRCYNGIPLSLAIQQRRII